MGKTCWKQAESRLDKQLTLEEVLVGIRKRKQWNRKCDVYITITVTEQQWTNKHSYYNKIKITYKIVISHNKWQYNRSSLINISNNWPCVSLMKIHKIIKTITDLVVCVWGKRQFQFSFGSLWFEIVHCWLLLLRGYVCVCCVYAMPAMRFLLQVVRAL